MFSLLPAGWWFVSTSEEQGWVPATYLEAQNGTRDDSDINPSKTGEVSKRRKAHLRRLDRRWTLGGMVNRQHSREEKYVTVQPYTSQSKDEIGFEKGVTVEVIRKNLEGWWYIRYLGKEGWAPASYLKKAKDDLPTRKKNLAGPVEIIGNIMEISNLLNKKASGDKETPPAEGEGHEAPIAKKEISLPILCNASNGSAVGIPDRTVSRLAQGSPAVARIAPQRAQISSPNLRTRPPPRRESSLGFQLPKPPEPPSVEVEYYTIAEFQSCISDGISFRGGQKAEVIDKNSGGWWYVQIGEKEGWAPASYIDKRKKPNLSRRTSTLTRPKVPPPAPPSKPKEAEEGLPGASENQDSPRKLKYEEPEYDIPAFGFDSEPELSEEPVEDRASGDRRSAQPCRPSPASSLQRARFKVGESSEDVALEEETIYENEGFRPYAEDTLSARGSSGDSDSPGSSSLSLVRKNSPRSGSPKSSSLLKLKAEKNAQAELGKNHSSASFSSSITINTTCCSSSSSSSSSLSKTSGDLKPRSASDAGIRGTPKVKAKKDADAKAGLTCARAKPSVRPKPFLNRAESQSQEKMDISTLRRQLRPTGQLRGGLKGSKSEDSELPPQTASEAPSEGCRRGSSDLITLPATTPPCPTKKEWEGPATSYMTCSAYQKVQDSEISFPAGVEVQVLEKQESGWWYVKFGELEGWAPSHYLVLDENKQPDPSGKEPDAVPTKDRQNEGKSDSLEKIERRVQVLNTVNQSKRATPPIPSKPPGGFCKTSGTPAVKMRNGVRQVAVRPQSVFVSPPPKDNNLSCALRRNESLTATDGLRGVRRNSSFSTARSATTPEAKGRLAERAASQGSDSPLLPTQRNGIPVSPVRPKPIEKSQFIHNNLKDVYVSIADYEGDEETAGFQEGVSMEVLERNPNGWWYCQILDGVKPFKGWVPSNYLEKKN
ncbi:SH3 and PX domain-containing protein 2A [Plecturocebus cupreus]